MHTVLTIDDDEGILTLVKIVLERAGYQVLQAANGIDGVQIAQTHTPDIILLDDTLPITPSHEVSRQLRSDPQTNHIPIIIFSASLEGRNPAYIQRMGGDEILPKPFRQHDLLSLLSQFLQHT